MPGPYLSFTPDDENPGMVWAKTPEGGEEHVPIAVAQETTTGGQDGAPPPPEPLGPGAPLPGTSTPAIPGLASGQPAPATTAPAPEWEPLAPPTTVASPGPDPMAGYTGAPAQTVPEVTTTTTKDTLPSSPEDRAAKIGSAYDAAGNADFAARQEAQANQKAALDTSTENATNRVIDQRLEIMKAEAMKAEQQRLMDAVEQTPLDEKAFWGDGGGRRIVAALAVALCEFGGAVSRQGGPNVAVQIIDSSLDRFLKRQLEDKKSKLAIRAAALNDADDAYDTAKLQLNGLVEKQMDLLTQQAAISQGGRAAAEAVRANIALKKAEAQEAILGRATGRVEEQTKKTQTKPVSAFGQRLAAELPGVTEETWAKAMDPKDGNLGGKIDAMTQLEESQKALQEIAAAGGGEFPQKEAFSLDSFPAARNFFARLGNEESQQAVTAQRAIDTIKLKMKQIIGNAKLIDSNLEAETVNGLIDAGTTEETLRGVSDFIAQGQQSMNATAAQYAPGNEAKMIELAKERSQRAQLENPASVKGGRQVIPPPRQGTTTVNGAPEEAGPLGVGPVEGSVENPDRSDIPLEAVPALKTPIDREDLSNKLANTIKPEDRKAVGPLFAQIMHETGGGKSLYGFNVGGIKGKNGKVMALNTGEGEGGKERIKANFRAYDNLDEGLDDYVATLQADFPKAWEAAKTGDAGAFARALKEEGYYTDSEANYARGLKKWSDDDGDTETDTADPGVTITDEPMADPDAAYKDWKKKNRG